MGEGPSSLKVFRLDRVRVVVPPITAIISKNSTCNATRPMSLIERIPAIASNHLSQPQEAVDTNLSLKMES